MSVLTWLPETFWASLACPGSFVSGTIAALVFPCIPSAGRDSLSKSAGANITDLCHESKRKCKLCLFFFASNCYLCWVFGYFAVVRLQCWDTSGLDPCFLFHPEQRSQRRCHHPAIRKKQQLCSVVWRSSVTSLSDNIAVKGLLDNLK